MRYHVYQFSDKTDNFEFLGQNLSKNEFRGQHFKNLSLHSESASLRYHVCQFLDTSDNFEFFGPNLPKNGICGQNFKNLEFQKSKIWDHILEIIWVPIFRQNGQLWISGPKFAQKWILESKFQKSKPGFGISILEILCVPIFRHKEQLRIFGPKFSQK